MEAPGDCGLLWCTQLCVAKAGFKPGSFAFGLPNPVLIHFMFLWTVHSLCAGLWSESQLAGGASSGGTSWIPWEIVQTLNVGLFADTPLG